MKYNPEVHHRKSLRLKSWDYSRSWAYFVTICAWEKECIFLENGIERIVVEQWNGLPERFQNVRMDEFVVMPNHLHGILWIVGAGLALPGNKNIKTNQPQKKGGPRPAPTLGDIVCTFKSKTTIKMNRFRNTPGNAVWQRNYFDRIIRNEDELHRTRRYIIENPLKWNEDTENPLNATGAGPGIEKRLDFK